MCSTVSGLALGMTGGTMVCTCAARLAVKMAQVAIATAFRIVFVFILVLTESIRIVRRMLRILRLSVVCYSTGYE